MTPRESAIQAARAAGATVLDTPSAIVLVFPISAAPDPNELLSLADAAATSKVSLRTLKDAIRAGDLPAVGRQRDRSVRRSALSAWIDSRSTRRLVDMDDYEARIEARMRAKGQYIPPE